MTVPIPIYLQEAYAILFNRFGEGKFQSNYLNWFLSKSMTKKILHGLERRGWIKRVRRGTYVCKKPNEIVQGLISFRVPTLLKKAGKKYRYTGASSVEIWTDFTYIQRSWEHSPYFINVLKEDVSFLVDYFNKNGINVFIEKAKPSLGEFVVLIPRKRFRVYEHNGEKVDKLDDVVKFCEENIYSFEYPLAYLINKFGIKSKADVDKRVIEETKKVTE